jgi:hypothetical protein
MANYIPAGLIPGSDRPSIIKKIAHVSETVFCFSLFFFSVLWNAEKGTQADL